VKAPTDGMLDDLAHHAQRSMSGGTSEKRCACVANCGRRCYLSLRQGAGECHPP
jgi:hypothetical protein